MRVFICSYNGFSLAIPMEWVASIFIIKESIQNKKIYHDDDNKNTFFSLPIIFNCHDIKAHHGIILKSNSDINNILLSTEIECEKDISRDSIFPVPKAFTVLQFSSIFNGIFFSSFLHRDNAVCNKNAKDIVLLLNPGQLVQKIRE